MIIGQKMNIKFGIQCFFLLIVGMVEVKTLKKIVDIYFHLRCVFKFSYGFG